MKLEREGAVHEPGGPELRRVTDVCRCAILLALAAQLLFAHGCHGDEDHELFGLIQHLTAESASAAPWGTTQGFRAPARGACQ